MKWILRESPFVEVVTLSFLTYNKPWRGSNCWDFSHSKLSYDLLFSLWVRGIHYLFQVVSPPRSSLWDFTKWMVWLDHNSLSVQCLSYKQSSWNFSRWMGWLHHNSQSVWCLSYKQSGCVMLVLEHEFGEGYY